MILRNFAEAWDRGPTLDEARRARSENRPRGARRCPLISHSSRRGISCRTLIKGDQREKSVILGAARQVIGSILPGHADK